MHGGGNAVHGWRTRSRRQLGRRSRSRASRFDGPSVLYLGQGDGSFVESAALAGFGQTPLLNGLAAADIGNDGDVDIFATALGTDRYYLCVNDGARASLSVITTVTGISTFTSANGSRRRVTRRMRAFYTTDALDDRVSSRVVGGEQL